MGSPQRPTDAQYQELERDGQLQVLGEPGPVNADNGQATIRFPLPRQGVSLVLLTW